MLRPAGVSAECRIELAQEKPIANLKITVGSASQIVTLVSLHDGGEKFWPAL
jgi:hypothetical protein